MGRAPPTRRSLAQKAVTLDRLTNTLAMREKRPRVAPALPLVGESSNDLCAGSRCRSRVNPWVGVELRRVLACSWLTLFDDCSEEDEGVAGGLGGELIGADTRGEVLPRAVTARSGDSFPTKPGSHRPPCKR